MHATFLTSILGRSPPRTAIVWKDTRCMNEELVRRVSHWERSLDDVGIEAGRVVALEGDFSPNSVALLLALVNRGAITVPLVASSPGGHERHLGISRAQAVARVDAADKVSFAPLPHDGVHPVYERLRRRGHPGLVLFTSGSTGEPKAAVHDFPALLEKFRTPRRALTTLNFLQFDHWGGLNTLFHALSNASTVVTIDDRTPENACRLIEKYRVELLPASPTFLNLLLLSGAHKRHDLDSLKVVTYGAEPMPQGVLKRLAKEFPDAKLQQTYGLIEVGVLRSKSRDKDSLWVKVGGEGYATRVRDGLLEIKANSAMLAYLNAPSPFTEDGWFMTGDMVEQDGEYLRILGRKSELINVGGEKVHPAEIEGVIQELDNIAEVTVRGERNAILGNIVTADIRVVEDEDGSALGERVKAHCRKHLKPYMIPVRISLTSGPQFGQRFKKLRRSAP